MAVPDVALADVALADLALPLVSVASETPSGDTNITTEGNLVASGSTQPSGETSIISEGSLEATGSAPILTSVGDTEVIANGPICGNRMPQSIVEVEFELDFSFSVLAVPQYIYEIIEEGELPQDFPSGSYVWVEDELYTSGYPESGSYVQTTGPQHTEQINYGIDL
jgi:hypothetical protein